MSFVFSLEHWTVLQPDRSRHHHQKSVYITRAKPLAAAIVQTGQVFRYILPFPIVYGGKDRDLIWVTSIAVCCSLQSCVCQREDYTRGSLDYDKGWLTMDVERTWVVASLFLFITLAFLVTCLRNRYNWYYDVIDKNPHTLIMRPVVTEKMNQEGRGELNQEEHPKAMAVRCTFHQYL